MPPAKKATAKAKPARPSLAPPVETYTHPEATSVLRPDVGTQAQFKKRKPPKTYRFDSSLSPALEWDGQNATRELGEWLIGLIKDPKSFADAAQVREFKDAQGNVLASVRTVQEAADLLAKIARPFLNWAGKAERLSFDVPTLPLFVHERLSTKAILETLKGHKRDKQLSLFDLFGDAQHSIYDQVLRAYEHADGWTNRLILGDSLVVMNSLLQYEGLGGQVQMIYIDPPYGVKFGSNFQPFVRKRDVAHNDDEDMTREPEMVKAYRDTWELGLHSYLTYMRDRLLIARNLLTPSGSIFVQISDENVHHVRELMDDVFGETNFCGLITFTKTSGATPVLLGAVSDYLLWYAKDKTRVKYHDIFEHREPIENPYERYICVETPDGEIIDLSVAQKLGEQPIPDGRLLRLRPTDSQGASPDSVNAVAYDGKNYYPPKGRHWSVTSSGMQTVVDVGRAYGVGNTLLWKSYRDEFPYRVANNNWTNIKISGFGDEKLYVVQTLPLVIQRCMLMTTDPGDLVLDPTCGSGTTAHVAEQWGRRWITCDVSRVPLALARQRLLTATFPFYQLKDELRGPAAGFVYKRKQNNKGEEVGGIVPHITLKAIAYNEPPEEEVLVDRPESINSVTRVTGPFAFEATIPTPMDWEESSPTQGEGARSAGEGDYASFVDRMLEVLRKSPVLHIGGGKTVTLYSIRPPAKTLSLSAEALVDASAEGQTPTLLDLVDEAEEKSGRALPLSRKLVAIVFGPENGSVSERLVYEAAREAHAKGYTYLYVIGFAIQPNARDLIDKCESIVDIPATYIQATPDLMMGDLLKNMRSSQIFSVCGLPEIKITGIRAQGSGEAKRYQVELLGLDVFDPATLETEHRGGNDVPAWFLDADYNGLCFHVSQAFFPRTAAWDALKRALKGTYEDSVWDHLAGTLSEPFEAGDHHQIAVKVIDDRGNELLVVKSLK